MKTQVLLELDQFLTRPNKSGHRLSNSWDIKVRWTSTGKSIFRCKTKIFIFQFFIVYVYSFDIFKIDWHADSFNLLDGSIRSEVDKGYIFIFNIKKFWHIIYQNNFNFI